LQDIHYRDACQAIYVLPAESLGAGYDVLLGAHWQTTALSAIICILLTRDGELEEGAELGSYHGLQLIKWDHLIATIDWNGQRNRRPYKNHGFGYLKAKFKRFNGSAGNEWK